MAGSQGITFFRRQRHSALANRRRRSVVSAECWQSQSRYRYCAAAKISSWYFCWYWRRSPARTSWYTCNYSASTLSNARSSGLKLATYLVIMLVAVLGGRVIPFFTNGGLNREASRQWKVVEILAIASLLLLMILELTVAPSMAIAVLAGLAALMHAIRLYGWYQAAIWRVPLLWVLHLGYTWLVVGLLLLALGVSGLISPLLYLHAFTLGVIGSMTLGMMARVSLGHTGRELVVGWPLSAAFALINLAAVTRVILPLLDAQHYSQWIILAGVFWTLAFMLFVFVYARILILPRVDGRPG